MALDFREPTIIRAGENPADQFVNSAGASFDLGFTEPRYEGQVALQRRGMFGAPPSSVKQHEVQITPEDDGFTGTVTRVPNHSFSWQITLPPSPQHRYILAGRIYLAWKSARISLHAMCALFANLRGKLANFPDAMPDAGAADAQLIMIPMPDHTSFMRHIEDHEYQHVADHRWLAEQIFGPIDRWAQQAMRKRLRFTAPKRPALHAALQFPGSYAISQLRIYSYWQRCIKQSGDLYHGTQAGSFPRVGFVRVDRTHSVPSTLLLVLSVEAVHPIVADVTLRSPPHARFRLVPPSDTLDGNEPDLTAAGAVDREITALGVYDAAVGDVIPVPMEAEQDIGLGGFFNDD